MQKIVQVTKIHQLNSFNTGHFCINLPEIAPVASFIKTIRNFSVPCFPGVRIFRPLGFIIFKRFPSNRAVNMKYIVHDCIGKKLVSSELKALKSLLNTISDSITINVNVGTARKKPVLDMSLTIHGLN